MGKKKRRRSSMPPKMQEARARLDLEEYAEEYAAGEEKDTEESAVAEIAPASDADREVSGITGDEEDDARPDVAQPEQVSEPKAQPEHVSKSKAQPEQVSGPKVQPESDRRETPFNVVLESPKQERKSGGAGMWLKVAIAASAAVIIGLMARSMTRQHTSIERIEEKILANTDGINAVEARARKAIDKTVRSLESKLTLQRKNDMDDLLKRIDAVQRVIKADGETYAAEFEGISKQLQFIQRRIEKLKESRAAHQPPVKEVDGVSESSSTDTPGISAER